VDNRVSAKSKSNIDRGEVVHS